MAWRLAKSLDTLRKQANEKWPGRSKASDGTIGDEAHASRGSDHNPWVKDGATGIVTGMDLTHDPGKGLDSQQLAEALVRAKDRRVKYIISNRRICSGSEQDKPAWVWRPYSGSNAHNHHVHISVKPQKELYDSVAAWKLDDVAEPTPQAKEQAKPTHPTLRRGASGDAVKELQKLLGITADGAFGPATEAAVKAKQTALGITADGIVGPYSWEKFDVKGVA